MNCFLDFIREWGYVAVFLGSLVEGESVILTASSLASQGYFNISTIMITAFCGTVIADQLLYMLGRYYGPAFFERFQFLKKSSQKAFKMLHKYDVWFIIICRFVYGIRITSAIAIGAGGVVPQRFIPLNILSGAIWTVVSCGGGYLLGDFIFSFFQTFEQVQKYIFAFIGAVVVSFLFYKKFKRKTP